jgi:histidine triad (HIT) family protein
MEDCIFCMIARGEIPAKVVFENETVIAFDDIAPQAPIHTLIIPREHYSHLGDGVPENVTCALFAAVTDVAEAKGLTERGYRVIVNTGPDAQQSVHHLHVHVLGGARMSAGMVSFDEGR